MAMDVRPCRAASSADCTRRSLCESRALVASSSSSNGGFRTKARQMATRCFCPPERRLPRGPTCVSQPWALLPSMKLRLAIFLHCCRCSSETFSPSSRPYITFSRIEALNRIGSWPTKPICLRHHRMLSSRSGCCVSPMSTSPLPGS
mmetsp:Transcript_57944/g.138020  ORF Transcript_57944/g.138020 Transcript_57944/m.138020 type:complete len:147 (-) Transcript_57944:3428-3868(-)